MVDESIEMPNPPEPQDLSPSIKEFLDKKYLEYEYVIPKEVELEAEDVAEQLKEEFPEFVFLTLVGGLANGSLEMRRLQNPSSSTDLDFYIGGHSVSIDRLREMARIVIDKFRHIGISPDATLNGRDPKYYLDLDQIDKIIEGGNTNLLALPFQASFGNVEDAEKSVLNAVIARSDQQEVWNEVREYHSQSLSLHHGSWNDDTSNFILNNYYPVKLDKFQLPETAEETLVDLSN